MVDIGKGSLGYDVTVVIGPASNLAIELPDQIDRLGGEVGFDQSPNVVVSRANEATDLRHNAASRSDGFGGSGRLVFSWFFGVLQPLSITISLLRNGGGPEVFIPFVRIKIDG